MSNEIKAYLSRTPSLADYRGESGTLVMTGEQVGVSVEPVSTETASTEELKNEFGGLGESWEKAKAFEKTEYEKKLEKALATFPCEPTPMPERIYGVKEFRFSDALSLLRAGFKMARKGWNGKGMFIVMARGGFFVSQHSIQKHACYAFPATTPEIEHSLPVGTAIEKTPFMCMYAADGKWVTGWLASQTDLVSDDWVVVTWAPGDIQQVEEAALSSLVSNMVRYLGDFCDAFPELKEGHCGFLFTDKVMNMAPVYRTPLNRKKKPPQQDEVVLYMDPLENAAEDGQVHESFNLIFCREELTSLMLKASTLTHIRPLAKFPAPPKDEPSKG